MYHATVSFGSLAQTPLAPIRKPTTQSQSNLSEEISSQPSYWTICKAKLKFSSHYPTAILRSSSTLWCVASHSRRESWFGHMRSRYRTDTLYLWCDRAMSGILPLSFRNNQFCASYSQVVSQRAERNIFLIMEYCAGGDLTNYIKKRGRVESLEYASTPGAALQYYPHPRSGGLDEVVVRSFLRQLGMSSSYHSIHTRNVTLNSSSTQILAN
jgi:serine/threonine protein kinase